MFSSWKLVATIAWFALLLAPGASSAQSRCNLLKAAQDYAAIHYPGFDPAGLKVTVSDVGNLVELRYELPYGVLGLVPVFMIDKRSCAVVSTRLTR